MKRLLVILFAFISFCSFSQNFNEGTEMKNSLVFFASPAEFTYWNYNMKVNEEWSGNPKHLYVTPLTPRGVGYQYQLNYLLKLQCAVAYDQEHFLFDEIVGGTNLYINYKVSYLKVPLGVSLYLSHFAHEEAIGGFFIQVNGNFDFVTREDIQKKSSLFVDPRFPKPPNYVSPPVTTTETHSDQLKFHRICPSISIGQEIVGDRISFFYGGRLELQAIYQNKNIQEYFRNVKFSLINVGLSYRL